MSRTPWGRIVVGGLLVVLGAGWLLQSSGLLDFPSRALTPLALIGVGIALVIGSRYGSYPWLIAVGAILTLILVWSPLSDRPFRWDRRDFGRNAERTVDRVERPLEASELRPYRMNAGRLTIDLTRLRLEERTYDVSARADAGEILVILPAGVPVRSDARSGVGSVNIFGAQRSSGFETRRDFESSDYDESRPRFDLRLRIRVGSIRVIQESVDESA